MRHGVHFFGLQANPFSLNFSTAGQDRTAHISEVEHDPLSIVQQGTFS